MKAKLSFDYDHHFKFPKIGTGFLFKVNHCQCKLVFANSNFEVNLSTYVFGKFFFYIIES